MYKNRFFMQVSVFLFSLFLLSGCGTNNSQAPAGLAPGGDGNISASIASLSISGGDVTVSQNSEAVTIRVKALTKDDRLATDGKVLAQYIDTGDHEGELTPAEVDISEGFATFVYVAPKDLQHQIDIGNNGTSFKFYKENDLSVTAIVNIIFDTSVDTTSSDPISKLILSESTINITKAEETKSITIQGLKLDNTAVINGKVLIEHPSTGNVYVGTVPAEVSITDGVGTFTYTAPVDIVNAATVSPANFKIYDKTNPSVSATLSVNFGGGTSATPRLSVSPYSVSVSNNSESVPVTVIVTDENGLALQSGTVEVLNPNGARDGYFSQREAEIANGIASFSYTGPNPLSAGSAIFTFRFKENTSYSATWRVTFAPDPGVAEPTIGKLVVNKDVEVGTSGESVTIQVLAFTDSAGTIPATSGTVNVRYPSSVATLNVGTMSPATAEIGANGIANFSFTAPTPLVNIADQTFSFFSGSTSDDIIVKYTPKPDVNNPIADKLIVLNGSEVNITKNSEVVTIRTRVFGADNNPFNGGNVKIQYPVEASQGIDVGSFSELSVPCVNGVADFNYNAPSDLAGRSDVLAFTFYHDSVGSAASANVDIRMNPDPNQIILTNYVLNMSASDGNNTMGLEQSKTFTVAVTDEDGNKLLSDANYTITNLNPLIADINDTLGNAAPLLIEGINANFSVTSKKKSGVLPIKVSVDFTDANGLGQTIEKIFNVIIYSGPPTAMSISYVATNQDAEHSQFIEIFSVKLTDKYNNPVNTSPSIHVGAIAGYAKDAAVYSTIQTAVQATRDGTYTPIPVTAHFANSELYNGNLIALRNDADISNYSTTQSQATIGNTINYDTSSVDTFNNVFVSFGDGYVYQKSGKWDIDSLDPATDTFILDEKYDDPSNGFDMGFAIGNNFRQDTCKFAQEWVLTTESDDGTYKVDPSGYARIKLLYDYYLTGKDIVVYANLIGDVLGATDVTARVGEAKKVTLRGHELEPYPNSYTIPLGSPLTPGYIFSWKLKDTKEWYYNGNFGGFELTVTGDGAYCTNPVRNDYRNCENGGVAFISYSCAGGTADGSVTISDSVVGTELQY